MSGFRAIAAVACLSAGFGVSENVGIGYWGKTDLRLPDAPPEPLTKRQRRRLRGKGKS